MKDNNSNIHSGHRERLTNLVINAGLENTSDIQAVEFFLTYIFPRGDVTPLAHRLLDKYENFGNIIDASESDLMQTKGINSRSAKKIKMFADIINYYTYSKINKKANLKNTGEFLDQLEMLLRAQPTENLYIFSIDHSFNITSKRRFDLKQVRAVGISPLELYNIISSTHPSYIIICHNHPNGTAQASEDDHKAAKYIDSLLENLNCTLLDSFIVGKDGIYSERQNSFIRTYSTNDIKKII